MNPWQTPSSSPPSSSTEFDDDVFRRHQIALGSPRRIAQRRGYGWYDCVRKDAEQATKALTNVKKRQAESIVAVHSGLSYRAPPSAPQRAMAFYMSPSERRRFLEFRSMTVLWPHQERGMAFMRQREQEGAPSGGIIAYKMRAGKTLMIGAHILEDLQRHVRAGGQRFGQPTLFLTPPQALDTIAGQIEQHFGPPGQSALNAVVISSQHPFMAQSMNWAQELIGTYDLIITSYSFLSALYRRRRGSKTKATADDIGKALPSSDGPTLLDFRYRRVIADEAHVFCNQDIQLFRAVRMLKAGSRWFVTGTPIRNAAADLLSPLAFLRVPEPIPALDSSAFHDLLHRLMIRHFDDEVTPSPPGLAASVDDVVVRLDFATAIEQRLYTQAQTHTQLLLRSSRTTAATRTLSLILRLRQICVDPHLVAAVASPIMLENYVFEQYGAATWSVDSFLQDAIAAHALVASSLPNDPRRALIAKGGYDEAALDAAIDRIVPLVATKVRYIFEYYEQVIERTDEKLVIFSSWASFLERLARLFELRARLRGDGPSPHLLVHGKVERRTELFHAFQTDETHRVLLLTTGTGGVSLDLTRANHAILADLWFNPFTEAQALARLQGVNQSRPVHVRRLCIHGTIDEQILLLAESKRRLEDILNPTAAKDEDDTAAATTVSLIPADSTALLVAWILDQGQERPLKRKQREWDDAGLIRT
jgi:SWI/SNF-related matrix-associated actin-dependent regulator of chromatin subfamily A3